MRPLSISHGLVFRGQANLDSGDVFLLVTDGFFEWANPEGDQFRIQCLENTLVKCGSEAGQTLIASLLDEIETFAAGTPQPDDLTAIAIRRSADNDEQE